MKKAVKSSTRKVIARKIKTVAKAKGGKLSPITVKRIVDTVIRARKRKSKK